MLPVPWSSRPAPCLGAWLLRHETVLVLVLQGHHSMLPLLPCWPRLMLARLMSVHAMQSARPG